MDRIPASSAGALLRSDSLGCDAAWKLVTQIHWMYCTVGIAVCASRCLNAAGHGLSSGPRRTTPFES